MNFTQPQSSPTQRWSPFREDIRSPDGARWRDNHAAALAVRGPCHHSRTEAYELINEYGRYRHIWQEEAIFERIWLGDESPKRALKFRHAGFDCAGLLTSKTYERDNSEGGRNVKSKPHRTTSRDTLCPVA